MALVEEVVQEYRTSLKDLIVNSKPLINMLTMLADDNEQHAPFIVEVIEDHISKCRPEKKLPVLYLIDSIMKNLPKSSYRSLFARNIVTTFTSVFEKVDEKNRASMYKLRQTWVEILASQKLYKIDLQIHNLLDPAWPITAPPPEQTSIHVNPKFLSKASSDGERSSPEMPMEEEEEEEKEEELVDPKDDVDDQDTLLRKQLIAKQQELLRIKQASLELELAEAEEQMKQRKKQAAKSSGAPSAKSSTKHQLSPKAAFGVDVPAAPRDPRLTAGGTISSRDPRLARTSVASSATPTSLSNPLVSSSLSAFPSHNPASSAFAVFTPRVGSPPYASTMAQYNGLPVPQPEIVCSGPSEMFTGEVFNSPDSGARFSDDSESSRSSWQEIRNLPPPPAQKINTRDPRFQRKAEENTKENHNDSHARRHQHTKSGKHPVTDSKHHHGTSSKHYTEDRHHTDAYKHHQESGRSQHSSVGKYPDDKVQRHSTGAKEFKRDSKERERNSKERDRLSKERESVSPRHTSSHTSTHRSSNSHHTSKYHSSPKDKESNTAENVRESKETDRRKSVPEKRKLSDSNSGSKISSSKSSSSLKSSSKTEVVEKSRNSNNKSRDVSSDKIPKKSSSNSNQHKPEKDKHNKEKIKSEDLKKQDSKTSLKESVSRPSIEKKPEKSKSDTRIADTQVKIENTIKIKEELMDTDEPVPVDIKSPETPAEKGEKRSSENEATPRVIKKLKLEIDAENDNNNSTCDTTVKMETSKPSLANDISDLFGSEDQDYRSVDQKGLPMKSPSSKGWDTFKAQHADEFAHDIQLKKQREEMEMKKREEEPQDTDYRVPQRQTSTASEATSMSREILDHHEELLLLAHKQLREGSITHEQHQELIRNVGELMHIKKTMTELSSPECEKKPAKDLSAGDQDIDSDLRNTSPRQDEPSRSRVSISPEKRLERFKIPRLRDGREGSPRNGTADARGELQNLYPDLPGQEQGPRSGQYPENDPRGDLKDRRGPARRLDRGEPVDAERREREWQPVSPDKAKRGQVEEAGWRGQPVGEFGRKEELGKRGSQDEVSNRGPREQGWRGDMHRRGPPGDTDTAGPPDDADRRRPHEDIRGPARRGLQGEFRRGPPREFDRRGPPENLNKGRPVEEFLRQGPPEDFNRRGPPGKFDRLGQPGDFDRRGPPGEHENWGSSEEFDERGGLPPGEFKSRPPGGPPPLGPRNEPNRPERFARGQREPPQKGHEDWNRTKHPDDRGHPEELPEGHPDWRPPPHRRPHPDDKWHGEDTCEPHGQGMRHRENVEESQWNRSPRDDLPHGPDGLGGPKYWVNPPPGPPMPGVSLIRARSPQKVRGSLRPRGPMPERFRGQQNSPYSEFPDHPPAEERDMAPENIDDAADEGTEKVFDPHHGLPPWQPVERKSPPKQQNREERPPPPQWKKGKSEVPDETGPFLPWEPAESEQGKAPGFQGRPFRPRQPMQEGPVRFPGPASIGPPPFRGPPPQQLQDGPPVLMEEQDQHGAPVQMMGPEGPLHTADQDGPPPLHVGPPVSRPVNVKKEEVPETRTHTEHLPAFLGPANPKPSRSFRDEQNVQPLGKYSGAPRQERPRMQGPTGPRPGATNRPPFNGPMRPSGPPRGPGPVFPEESQNRVGGPQPPVEGYVDMNGDPRFRSFVDMSPEVSEEVVFGKKNYEIKLGAPPRRIQWGAEFIEVYADPSKRGVIVDGVLMYKFGERVKEVQIRGRKEKIFYHGKPLNLWIEGQNYEVRVDSPPKAIFINSKPHRIQIDGRDMMILIDKEEKGQYGGQLRFIFIDGDRMEIRFDPPPRHILIDGKLCELKLNMAQPCVNIEGKLHGIRFDGPPRDVFINGNLYQIFTDHAIKVRVGNRFHYVALGGPCHELIVDGKWFEVKFNEQAKEVTLGNTVLFVQLPGPPPEVKILPELRPVEPMPMPGPHNGPPMQMVPGLRPMMVLPPAGMPPMSVPGPMMPPPSIPMGLPQPMMSVSAVGQPASLPSSLSTLFPTAPAPVQPAVSAPMDINSLLARLVSTGMLPKDQKPVPAGTATRGPAKKDEKKEKQEPVLPQEYASIKKKNQPKEEKFDEIPDMTEMQLSRMKVLPSGAIQRMYAGVQCNSCGSRFRLDDDDKAERYRQHLDWHFRLNKRDKEDTRVVRCRKWYYGIMDWLQYEEIGDTEDQGKSSLFEQQQQHQVASPSQPTQPHIALITVPEGSTVLKCPPATGNDNDDLCDICHEPFEQYWDEDNEQWHLRDAIRVNNKTYHPICYEDYTDVSEGTPSPSVLNITEPNFSGRKNNYDESSQDGIPHSSFEEERGAIKTEPNSTSPSDSDIVVKLEPVFQEESMVVDQEDIQPSEPVPAASYTAVTIKTESVENVEAIKVEPMDTEPIQSESEVDHPSDGDVLKVVADVEPNDSYQKTGILPGLDIEPETVLEETPEDIVKTEIESPPSAIKVEKGEDGTEEQTEEKAVETIEEVSAVDQLEEDIVHVSETVEKEEQLAVETETSVEEEKEIKVSDKKCSTQNVISSSLEEEVMQANSDKLESVPEGSMYTPLTALSRVKLALPSDMSEISPEVLEIGSNASTPTRDELPSPPSEEC